jgi:ATP-dependent RNA helicase DDX24/MAK5
MSSYDLCIHCSIYLQRGVGAKAVGTSISLVAPAEEREHQKICEAVRGVGSRSLDQVKIDGRLLNEAQERVSLATKIVSCNDVESQAKKKNKWLQDAAKDAGLDVDEDMMEGGLLDGDLRDRQRYLDAKRAKTELSQLLAKPMRIQHFGKFLSGAGLRESIKSETEVKPFVVKKQSSTKGKQRRRKGSK